MDYSKSYKNAKAIGDYRQYKENNTGGIDAKTLFQLLKLPKQLKMNKANYNVGKDVLSNYGKTKTIHTPASAFKGTEASTKVIDYNTGWLDNVEGINAESIKALQNYQRPEGLMKYIEGAKGYFGYGPEADIARTGKAVMDAGVAGEAGASAEAIAGANTANSGMAMNPWLLALLGLGYGVGKRGSTFSRALGGGRKD